jgi:hypothetical protein
VSTAMRTGTNGRVSSIFAMDQYSVFARPRTAAARHCHRAARVTTT